MRAARPIDAGSEVTINYGFDSIFCPRAERQRHLAATFGFDCRCAKCEQTGEALRMSEERIARLVDAALLSELQWCGEPRVNLVGAAAKLRKLEQWYELMRAECPDGHVHGLRTTRLRLCLSPPPSLRERSYCTDCTRVAAAWPSDHGCHSLPCAGVENFLQLFVEWCEWAAAQCATLDVRHYPEREARRVDGDAYLAAARAWAVVACNTAREMSGDDSVAHRVWRDALERGCWSQRFDEGGGEGGAAGANAAPASPDWRALWQAGVAAPPLGVALGSSYEHG